MQTHTQVTAAKNERIICGFKPPAQCFPTQHAFPPSAGTVEARNGAYIVRITTLLSGALLKMASYMARCGPVRVQQQETSRSFVAMLKNIVNTSAAFGPLPVTTTITLGCTPGFALPCFTTGNITRDDRHSIRNTCGQFTNRWSYSTKASYNRPKSSSGVQDVELKQIQIPKTKTALWQKRNNNDNR